MFDFLGILLLETQLARHCVIIDNCLVVCDYRLIKCSQLLLNFVLKFGRCKHRLVVNNWGSLVVSNIPLLILVFYPFYRLLGFQFHFDPRKLFQKTFYLNLLSITRKKPIHLVWKRPSEVLFVLSLRLHMIQNQKLVKSGFIKTLICYRYSKEFSQIFSWYFTKSP